MNDIYVKVLLGDKEKSLLPKLDNDSKILEVSSKLLRDWTYGIDIDGNIIFDIDDNFILANFDLLIPPKLWKKIDSFPNFIKKKGVYNLIFENKSIKIKSFNLPLNIFLNDDNSILIEISTINSELVTCYPLSPKCNAIVEKGKLLKGFLVEL